MALLPKRWPKTYKERSKFIFNNDLLSDVKFVVQASRNGESDSKRSKMEIPAHKCLLSIYSPVFFAMFCSEMAETKERIDLPDCEYEGMLELLRYIYTDEVCLNNNNVMQVLYLAEKYMISSLANECAKYLRENLDCSVVLGVLKYAQQYENEDLPFQCWDFIDKKTEEVLKSSDFVTMERCFLEELLDRDTLNVKEVKLFKAVDCWAEKEFMREDEFINVVTVTNILTEEETSNIMKYFNSTLTLPVGFLETKRLGSPLRCSFYSSFDNRWYDSNIPEEWQLFVLTVDKDIILHGVSLFGNDGDDYLVTLRILHDKDDSVLTAVTGTFKSVLKTCPFNGDVYYGFDVLLDFAVALKKDVPYCVQVSVDGPDSCVFQRTQSDVVHCAGVTFKSKYGPPTQFPELWFKVK
ncbi:BTB/POZ domain-containing protein 6-like [Oculina patagonica]